MAYINQADKKIIKSNLDKVMPKGWKFSLSIQHSMKITLNIKSAPVDLVDIVSTNYGKEVKPSYISVSQYYIGDIFNKFPELKTTFEQILTAMKSANWFDKSDSQSDYFHTAYYIDITLGTFEKPFLVK